MKRIIGILLSTALVISMCTPIYANEGETETESSLKITKAELTAKGINVKGKSSSDITAVLVRPGHEYAELSGAANAFDIISDMDRFEADENGEFSFSFTEPSISEEYHLYISNGTENLYVATEEYPPEKKLYVSPDGSDQNNGDRLSPLRTLGKAKEKIKEYADSGEEVRKVVLAEGDYGNESVTFDASDSGSVGEPIKYVADGARFTGTKEIPASAFKPVSDSTMKSKLKTQAADKVLCADLSELGFSENELDFLSSFVVGSCPAVTGIYVDGNRQMLARYPNNGYMKIDNVVQMGGRRRWAENPTLGAVFYQYDDNLARWENATNAYAAGFLGAEYWSEWAKIKKIDGTKQEVEFKEYTQYGVLTGYRWYITNLIEELDIPGEFYIEDMKLYLFPEEDFNANTKIEIAVQEAPVINVNGAQNLEFDGFEIFGVDDKGIKVVNGKNITIKNCDISDTKSNGIYAGGDNITIDGCDVYNTYDAGIYLANGGVRQTLTSSGNVISNNHVYNTGTDSGTNWNGGIQIAKNNVGTIIKNNMIHSIKNYSYSFGGNENQFIYNEVWSGNRETGDACPVYSGRDISEYGNVMSYNYVHDCYNKNKMTYSTYGIGTGDDWESGAIIENNIINLGSKNNAIAINSHSRDNVIRYNTMVNAKTGLDFTDRYRWIKNMFANETGIALMNTTKTSTGLSEGYAQSDIWLEKYPSISTIWQDTVDNNGRFMVRDNEVTDNLSVDAPNKFDQSFLDLGTFERNIETDDYSIFVDPDNHDYRLKASAVKSMGLSDKLLNENNFSMSEIGPQRKMEKASEAFKLTYPYNNSKVEAQQITLAWQAPKFVDEYQVQVATDKNFSNLVVDEWSIYNCLDIDSLAANQTYYWRVTARNLSKQIGNEWNSDVYTFSTDGGTVSAYKGSYTVDSDSTSVNAIISNTTAKDITNASVYTAFYNSDKSLKSVSVKNNVTVTSGTKYDFNAECASVSDFSEARIFMMDSDFAPLMNQLVLYEKVVKEKKEYLAKSFARSGEWTQVGDGMYVSVSEDAAAEFEIEAETAGSYDVYYWYDLANKGAKADIKLETGGGVGGGETYNTTLSLDGSQTGWIYVGRFNLTTMDGKGFADVTVTPQSGNVIYAKDMKVVTAY